ncbi:MAG: DNA replication/repair protein RecF [Micrococcales bacterium]
MLVKHLTLAQFRNHESTDIALPGGVVIFVGPNGQGKTNLVEAINYLATLSSHRVAGYLPLIRAQQPTAIIRALISHAGRQVQLEAELNANAKNRIRVNKKDSSRIRDLLGYVTTVCFAPEDLDIIKKDPSNRRNFIDQLLVQQTPRLAGTFQDYERVLKQRNTLLKSARANAVKGGALSTLDAWDSQLIALGTEIVVARNKLIVELNPLLIKAYEAIAVDRNQPLIKLKSSLVQKNIPTWDEDEIEISEEDFAETNASLVQQIFTDRLAEVRPKELERGLTLVGPQRDDLVLLLNDLPAKGYASHGESWSYALALRLAARELLRRDSNSGDPVLILDDVFAELDATRRQRLAELVRDNEQVLITTADIEAVPEELRINLFHVKNGVVQAGDHE